MNALAIPPLELVAYLQNVVDGRTMESTAQEFGCPRSTILRRIRRVEDKRDHPEWDAIIGALEEHRRSLRAPPQGLPGTKILQDALGVSMSVAQAEFEAHLPVLCQNEASLLIGDMPFAAVTDGAEPRGKLARNVMLFALAFGWVEPFGDQTGKVRQFRATKKALGVERQTAPFRSGFGDGAFLNGLASIENDIRRKKPTLTGEHLKAAQDFQSIFFTRETLTADTYRSLQAAVIPRLFDVLVEVCGLGTRFEELERKMGFPARSAKVIVALALESMNRALGDTRCDL
ncbi:MAG: DUF6456 domain-containing protein [Pseudomonadota bacterium]